MLKSHLFLRQQEQGTKSRVQHVDSDHGSPTQLNTPPLGCQHCCPPARLASSQGACIYRQGRTLTGSQLPSWKAFTVMLPGEVRWKHSQRNLSAPSPDPPSNAQLTTRAPTPPAQRSHPTPPAPQGNVPSVPPLLWHDLAST